MGFFMAALASDLANHATPAAPRVERTVAKDNRLQLRLVISIPAMLILVALAYGVVSQLSFSIFWDDLERAGAGEIARSLLYIHMNALILLAFASAAAGLILSKTILRPIQALLEATRQVAGGNLDLHASQIPSARELNDLSYSFNHMLDNINQSITARNRRLLEGMPIGVMMTGADGRIGAISPLACQILGLPAEQAIGVRIGELMIAAPQPAHVLLEYLLSRIQDCPDQATAEATLNDALGGKSLTVSSTQLSGGDGAPFGFMFSFRETTRMRNLSEQLSRSDQLAALGTFTLGLAHELRNPLGAIKGFSQLLLLERDLAPRVADYLGRMVQEVDRVDGLVCQLFDLSEQPLACRAPADLSAILETAAEMARAAADPEKARRIHLKLDLAPLPPLLLECDRLAQALGKIAQNAYEFTPDGGTITLRTRYEIRPGGPVWRAEVRNTGSTLAPEDAKRIFEPFFTTRDKGDRPWPDHRQPDRGPERRPDHGRHGRRRGGVPDPVHRRQGGDTMSAGDRVLIADDEPSLRMILHELLAREGCQVVEAEDGEQAVELARKGGFDLYLLDMKMPRRDGLEALREIRALYPRSSGDHDHRLRLAAVRHRGAARRRLRLFHQALSPRRAAHHPDPRPGKNSTCCANCISSRRS